MAGDHEMPRGLVRGCQVTGGGAEAVTLICTGSLTNAALLLTVYPEVKEFLQVNPTYGSMVGTYAYTLCVHR